jgi:quercetin dioxygenase-like cupin family protein
VRDYRRIIRPEAPNENASNDRPDPHSLYFRIRPGRDANRRQTHQGVGRGRQGSGAAFHSIKGDKTPVHSHPETVLYVVKGGKIRTTLADGTSTVVELKTGQASLRAPVTHSDEALDDIDAIIVELKK